MKDKYGIGYEVEVKIRALYHVYTRPVKEEDIAAFLLRHEASDLHGEITSVGLGHDVHRVL